MDENKSGSKGQAGSTGVGLVESDSTSKQAATAVVESGVPMRTGRTARTERARKFMAMVGWSGEGV